MGKLLGKLKMWLFGNIILKKVWGKFVKHVTGFVTGVVTAFVFRADILEVIQPVLDDLTKQGINVTPESVSLFTAGIVAGAFGALWNFIEHRFIKS